MKYATFTNDMKKDYKILVPTMLPIHFTMAISVLRANGYNAELLTNKGDKVRAAGLKYVHNDTCYPAQVVIGQLIDAIEHGGYDKHKIALLITQTGGGCRASNYISLLRKALEKAGYEYIPVLSLNVSGLDNAVKLTLPMIKNLLHAVSVGGLLDFCMYCVFNSIVDAKLYDIGRLKAKFAKLIYDYLIARQNYVIRLIKEKSSFSPPSNFNHVYKLTKGFIGLGAKMGEGWLLTAEILELIEQGVKNVICAQPFGCLPNHIVGKGMMKHIKEKYPDVNLVAIDYDAGASRVNQENRIKLMLANSVV